MATWSIDAAHSSVKFTVKHMMISKVHGTFSAFKGALNYDPEQPSAAKVEVSIDPNSISTGEPKRDEHLRSPDFFDVASFPTWTFVSTGIKGVGDDSMQVKGLLSLHGVSREVILTVEGPTPEMKDMYGLTRIGVSATTKISRKDFGLNWNAALEAGGVVVSDEVTIALDVQFVKQA